MGTSSLTSPMSSSSLASMSTRPSQKWPISSSSSSSSSSSYFPVVRRAVEGRRSLVLQIKKSSFTHGTTTPSFFNGGDGFNQMIASLEVVLKHRGGQGGGALGAQMNIFERIARIVRSYVNAIVSTAEDPEKILEQTVIEMNEDLTKLRQASAQILASQKQLENRYKTAQQAADDWYKKAKLALERGEENLAREALKRRKDYENNAVALKSQLEQQKGVVEKLISNTRLLESKIQEAKSKKDTLKARAQSAKTSQKVNEMLGNINTSSALAAFEKMEEKVSTLEAQADALNELSTDDLSAKFSLLEENTVDDDLASLKKEMLGTSKRGGELPPGRSTASGSAGVYPFRDREIEKELNELRERTREF